MSYNAYVIQLKNLRKHPNADRLQLAECFGNTVCVPLTYAKNEIGIYFPVDGQVSVEFGTQNNLFRLKDGSGNDVGGYMEESKRNITAIRLRGEKSDGLFLPLSCVAYTGVDLDELNIGDKITVLNGHEICTKYIPRTNKSNKTPKTRSVQKAKQAVIAPLFREHADTEQLAYNLGAFKVGDYIDISLKIDGTSQRTGLLPKLQGVKRTLRDKIFRRAGTPIYEWGYVDGTRRVVLDDTNLDGGFYGSNAFRTQHSEKFRGKLEKGETVYYEVVGYTDTGTPIMGECSNNKVKDKEFSKKYGKSTIFHYGCEQGASDIYVYRMTMTNEDGVVVEYTPDLVRYRCEQMGVKPVPVYWTGVIPEVEDAGDWVKNLAEQFYDGADPIGVTHIKEGVVVRIVNRPKFAAYKYKNFHFKVLSNIIVDQVEENSDISEDILSEM